MTIGRPESSIFIPVAVGSVFLTYLVYAQLIFRRIDIYTILSATAATALLTSAAGQYVRFVILKSGPTTRPKIVDIITVFFCLGAPCAGVFTGIIANFFVGIMVIPASFFWAMTKLNEFPYRLRSSGG